LSLSTFVGVNTF